MSVPHPKIDFATEQTTFEKYVISLSNGRQIGVIEQLPEHADIPRYRVCLTFHQRSEDRTITTTRKFEKSADTFAEAVREVESIVEQYGPASTEVRSVPLKD